jgi:hypothetical protein
MADSDIGTNHEPIESVSEQKDTVKATSFKPRGTLSNVRKQLSKVNNQTNISVNEQSSVKTPNEQTRSSSPIGNDFKLLNISRRIQSSEDNLSEKLSQILNLVSSMQLEMRSEIRVIRSRLDELTESVFLLGNAVDKYASMDDKREANYVATALLSAGIIKKDNLGPKNK